MLNPLASIPILFSFALLLVGATSVSGDGLDELHEDYKIAETAEARLDFTDVSPAVTQSTRP